MYIKVKAPRIAAKAKAGQFVILRTDETGERLPFTITETDTNDGSVSIIYQIVGMGTQLLAKLNKGDFIFDFAGPLGKPSELDGYKRAAVIGGGLGCAIAYPQAKQLFQNGTITDIIAGFRNADLIFLEEEMRKYCKNLIIVTDDGSNGKKGLVTDALKENIENGIEYETVIAIGPPIMMKFAVAECLKNGVAEEKIFVSFERKMSCAVGKCGHCKINETYICLEGPVFNYVKAKTLID